MPVPARLLFVALFALVTTPAAAQPVVGTLTAPFKGSGGVVLGPDGAALYVGDFGDAFGQDPENWGRDVKRVALAGGAVDSFAFGFFVATGNDVAADGDTLLQVELGRGIVWKIASDGTARQWATGFNSPVGIAAAPDGGAYVAECGGNVVSRVAPDGTRAVFAASDELNCPNGLTRGPDGTLYAVNFNDGKILRIGTDGSVRVLAVSSGGGNGHVRWAAGRLFVADRGGHRVLSVTPDGTVRVLAGTGVPGNDDGPAGEATFRLPNGIAVTPDGTTVYVSSKMSEDPAELTPVVIRVISGLAAPDDAPGR